MLFTDLLPQLLGQHPNGVPMPLGGPMLPPMAKSPSNATVTPTLGAHNVPPALDPAALMNAATNAQFKDLESQRLAWQIQQMKDFNLNDMPGLMSLYGPGGAGGGTTMPGTNGAFGGELSPAPSRTGAAAAGWGPLADPAVSTMRSAGASDAFIQAAMGHGLAEGGFQQPWAKAGGGESSFGHWQFNKGGELPGYEKFAAARGPGLGIDDPTDTRLQAMYLMQRADQLHPGITKTDDPNQAMDVLGTKFERYKGNAPGQRRDYLAAAQRALAVPDVPTADLGGAGTRYGAAFGGSTTPLSDTMATAINPIQVPPALQMVAAMGGGGGNIARGNAPPAQFYGDSVAHGTREAAGANGITKIGWRPDQVLGSLTGANPQGAPVVISSGITNSTATDLPRDQWKRDIALVPQQIAAARTSGAGNVALYGVGDGVRDHNEINAALRQIASDGGASFVPLVGTGAYTDQQGRFHAAGWHPQDYNAQNTYTRTQLGGEASLAGATQAGAPTQMAQAGPGTTSVTPLGGSAQPAVPTQAPPAFGTLAPGGMPNAPPPGANPQMVAAANMLRKAMAYSAAGLPVGQIMAQSVYNSPAFKAAVAGQTKTAEETAGFPFVGPKASAVANAQRAAELATAGPIEAAKSEAQRAAEAKYAGQIAAAQQQERIEPARPGSVVTKGGIPILGIPQIEKVTDPATGMESYRYLTPPLGQQAAANAPDLGVAKLGPGQTESLVVRGKEEQTQRQKVIDEANNAQQTRATLMSMENAASNFVQGPFAQHAQTAASYLRLIDPTFDKQVGSYEDFVKNAGMLTRQAVKDVSSRAAVQEFTMIGNTLPNPDMSPIGLRKVQNELIGLSDYRLAKAQAQQQFEQGHGGIGNVSGFETQFQKQASPYAFIVARMDPTDRREMFAKLQDSDQGRRELARLGEQLTFLKQSGLAQ